MTFWQPSITAGSGPRYIAIADAIQTDVKTGKLAPGVKLPPHRELAEWLGVTVGTVTRGYAEAAKRGLIHGETGRGTFVGSQHLLSSHSTPTPSLVDMRSASHFDNLAPDLSLMLRKFVDESTAKNFMAAPTTKERSRDYDVASQWINRYNFISNRDNLHITAGGQQSLTVALSAGFRPGDRIAVENITCPYIKTLSRRFHIEIVPVQQDEMGMLPEALEGACQSNNIQGVYLMPSCQNPTTAFMPEYRRYEIADIAREHDLIVLENETYGLMVDDLGTPFAELAPEQTFFMTSLSDTIAHGLGVAYLHSPAQHLSAAKAAAESIVGAVPPLMTAIARQWITDGTAERTLELKREEARKRVRLTRTMLSKLDLSLQKTSYFGWLELPPPWTARDLARIAEENDVLLATDETFVVGRTPLPHAVRLGLSGPSTIDALEIGLKKVLAILSDRAT